MKCKYCKHKLTLPEVEEMLTRQDMGRLIGKLGGKETLKRHGKDHYAELGRKGMASRWGNK